MPLSKKLCAFALCAAVTVPIFADFSAALCAEAGIMNEKTGEATESRMLSPGGGLSLFLLKEDHILGIFAHLSFLFPTWLNKNGSDIDLSFYDLSMQAGACLGPGLKLELGDLFRLNIGLGVNVLGSFASASESNLSYVTVNLGAAFAAEFTLEACDPVYFAIGVVASYDMFNYTDKMYVDKVSMQKIDKGWAPDYSMLAFRPYICIGFHFDAPDTDDD